MRLSSFRILSALAAVSLATIAVGCGGGSGTASGSKDPGVVTPAATGRATFVIIWSKETIVSKAAKTRLIPDATNSLTLELFDGATSLGKRTVTRSQANSAVTFSNLPVRALTARASAFASTDGTGTALSSGNIGFTTQASTTVTLTLTLASTVDSVGVDYTGSSIIKDEQINVLPTAHDANGNIVLLTPGKLTWTTSDATVVDLVQTPTGAKMVGKSVGTATITMKDMESGKSYSFVVRGITFSVNNGSPTLSIGDSFTFTASIAGLSNTGVTWSVVEAGGGSIDATGHYTAPATGGTYHVRATSIGDPTRYVDATVTVQSGSAAININ